MIIQFCAFVCRQSFYNETVYILHISDSYSRGRKAARGYLSQDLHGGLAVQTAEIWRIFAREYENRQLGGEQTVRRGIVNRGTVITQFTITTIQLARGNKA